jgi:Undecaprenyl-phosphate glucose phosphotransferase
MRHGEVLTVVIRSTDAAAVLLAAVLAFVGRFGWQAWPMTLDYALLAWIAALLLVVLCDAFGAYRSWRGMSLAQQGGVVVLGWALTWALLLLALFAFKESERYSRWWMGWWAALTLLLLLGLRLGVTAALRWARAHGRNRKAVVLVGATAQASEVLQRVRAADWAGFDVLAIFDARDTSARPPDLAGWDVPLRPLATLEDFVRTHEVAEVWITLPMCEEARIREVLHLLRHSTANVRYMPDLFAFRLINQRAGLVLGLPTLDLSTSPMVGVNRVLKALEDRALATLILLLISPLMALIALAVKLTSPGPVFYRQERIGWNNKPFMMLKFRTMPVDSEKQGVRWGNAKNKQTTKIGGFLRRTSLDELPQFINVLKGDMSIVGPRPERPMFVEEFKEHIPNYMKKHLVKAGITGWAQVHGWRGDTDLHKRIEYDLYYIENWSLWLDLKIIAMTVLRGFGGQNAY